MKRVAAPAALRLPETSGTLVAPCPGHGSSRSLIPAPPAAQNYYDDGNPICVEEGPGGTFEQQFQSDWGFALRTNGTSSDFAKDVTALLASLSVVDNNARATIGGGRTPLQPIALPLPPAPADE